MAKRSILPALRELANAQRKGAVAAAKVSNKIKQQILAEFRTGNTNFQLDIVEAYREIFRDSLVVSNLLGRRRSKIWTPNKQPSLQFSVYDEVLKTLQSYGDIQELIRKYDVDVLRILREVEDDIEIEIRQLMNQLIGDGAPVPKGIKELSRKFASLGLTPGNKYRLETMFRTHSQIHYNAGRYAADQEPVIQEILWGYEYSTVGDDRVRPEHSAMDGMRLPKDDPRWTVLWPPNGWGCRCEVIPIFIDEPLAVEREPLVGASADRDFQFNPGLVFAA